jgi:hypothetical protein
MDRILILVHPKWFWTKPIYKKLQSNTNIGPFFHAITSQFIDNIVNMSSYSPWSLNLFMFLTTSKQLKETNQAHSHCFYHLVSWTKHVKSKRTYQKLLQECCPYRCLCFQSIVPQYCVVRGLPMHVV